MALLDHDEWDLRRPQQRSARASPTIDALSALLRAGNDNDPARFALARELDCLIGVLPRRLLREATMRGRNVGVGADRVLIASGAIDEADYLRRFSHRTGLAIANFDGVTRADIMLHDDDVACAAQYGLFPMRDGNELVFVIAPRGMAMQRLASFVDRYPDLVARVRLASAADVDAVLMRNAGDVLAHDAAYALSDRYPALSAAPKITARPRRMQIARMAMSLVLAGLLTLPPDFALGFWTQMLALWFLAAIVLRSVAAFVSPPPAQRHSPRMPDADLPVYTVIAALYHEARCVDQLLRALNALDYPREKLDLIIAVESDDPGTRAAIARFGAMPHLRVVVAPNIAPRTKPKALNSALPFARGSFIAVFDAEDRPDPGQLRAALDAFANEADDVACAQASLCIHNAADSLFTRMFATEYAGQFDAVLPGLATMRMPLPLGGTSNHFRADVLRAIGGWDAWNVTEDADLGLRLARFGYRAVTFASTTQEEAPIRFAAWLKQRSRWMKGWMQTWSVHMRNPRLLWREAGWRGAATLNLVIGGNVVSALAYPVLLGGLAIAAMRGGDWVVDGLLTPTHFIAITAGIVSTIAIGIVGLARRRRLRDGWILLLTPIYWVCLSIATYRALWQLLRDPYRWDKTEHGLTGSKSQMSFRGVVGSCRTRTRNLVVFNLTRFRIFAGRQVPAANSGMTARGESRLTRSTNTASNPSRPRRASV